MQKNRIELAGYLAAKPAARVLPSGTKVANARLAEGYRYTDRETGKVREHTNWHSLVFYGVLADIAITYDKGENVSLEGTLQSRQFTLKDGSQRTLYEVVVRTCHLIAKPRSQHEAPAANEPEADQEGAGDQLPVGVPSKHEDWPA